MSEHVRAEGLTAVRVDTNPEHLAHPECWPYGTVGVDVPASGSRCYVCGGTITSTSDPANVLLMNPNIRSVQTGPKRAGCYICEDPEFAAMGLPLCRACPECGGHVAADDTVCDDCGHDSIAEDQGEVT